MIYAYYWGTTNGHKMLIALKEMEIRHNLIHIDIGRGDQFGSAFLKISPNNKIPAIVDHDPPGGGASVSLFESGAILLYLAEKTGKLLPRDWAERWETVQWVIWQVAGLGPYGGQCLHFRDFAPDPIPYAIERYTREASRLYAVLDRRLEGRDFVTGTFSIADIAIYPWIYPHARMAQDLADFPNLQRWYDAMTSRPSVQAAYAHAAALERTPIDTDEARKILLYQDAATVRGTG
jgi:GST-like protein